MRFFMATCAVAALLLSLGVIATPASAQDAELVPFIPQPTGVLIQKTDQFGEFGNVRLLVRLDEVGLDELRKRTGRTDFLVVGNADAPVILRDDGNGGDDRAGDALFTGVATIDDADLVERTDDEETTRSSDPEAEVPTFDGRSVSGSEGLTPFDVQGFLAGKQVALNPAVATLDAVVKDAEPTSAIRRSLATSRKGVVEIQDRFTTAGETVFQDKVLMLRDPSIVSDPLRTFNPCDGSGNPNGVWTFNHLMTEMANQPLSGINPSDFVEQWLNHWLTNQNINSFTAPARAQVQQLIDDWRAASGGGQLDLSIAPFRLLAIVPRLDLRRSRNSGGGYGGAALGDFLDAGEARFVFGVVLPPGYSDAGYNPISVVSHPSFPGCRVLRFSVIFEYGVPKCECKEVRNWARQWVKLNGLPYPSATYNQALERLTEQFVRRNANPIKPNGSAINQIRTNDFALASLWQLREFQLTQFPFSFLEQTTVLRTADDGFNPSPTFDNWVLGLPSPTPPVPLFFNGAPFQGSKSDVPSPGHFWDVTFAPTLAQNNRRHRASLDACNGCHAGESGTFFVHVDPGDTNAQVGISGFLTGITINDPKISTVTRTFDDLDRRELDIKRLAKIACLRFHRFHKAHVLTSLQEAKQLPPDLFEGLTPDPPELRLSIAGDDMLSNIVTAGH